MTVTGAQIGIYVYGDSLELYQCARRHVIVPESLACVEWLEEGAELVPHKYDVLMEIYYDALTTSPFPTAYAEDQTQTWDLQVDPVLPAEAGTIGTWDASPFGAAGASFTCLEYPIGSPRYPDPALQETYTAPSLQRGKMIAVDFRNRVDDRADAYTTLGLFVGEVHDQDYDEGRTGQGSEARFAEICNRVTSGKRPSENYRAASSWMASRVIAHTLNRLQRAAVCEACVPVISCATQEPE